LSIEQRTKSQESRTKSQDSRTKSQEPRLKNREQRAKSQDQRAKSQEPRVKSQESGIRNQEPEQRLIATLYILKSTMADELVHGSLSDVNSLSFTVAVYMVEYKISYFLFSIIYNNSA